MTRSRIVLPATVGGALAAAVAVTPPSVAQDAGTPPTGLRLEVDVSAGALVETNESLSVPSEGTTRQLQTTLRFGLRSETRTETFALTSGTRLRYGYEPGEGTGFDVTEPRFQLAYTRQAARSRLAVAGSLQRQEVETLEPFVIDLNGDEIIDVVGFADSQGTLTQSSASVTLETGIDRPIGTVYRASYSSREFQDTNDPSLYDIQDYRLSTTTSFRFSEVTIGRLDLSYRDFEYTRARELDGQTYSGNVGLTQALSPTVTATASIGYFRRETDERIGNGFLVEENDGIEAAFSISKDLPRGALTAAFTRQGTDDSIRNTLTFGRSLQMTSSQLNLQLGATALDDGDVAPRVRLTYVQDLADGALTASLRREVAATTLDEERTFTGASVDYSRAIDELSSLRLGVDYAVVSSVDDAGEDEQTRATFTAAYVREITRDWDLSVGYTGRYRLLDGEDAFSNAVFFDIGRSFVIRP